MAPSQTQRVLESFNKGGDEWIDVLFENYPYWDDEGVAPKCLYVLLNSFHERRYNNHQQIQEYRTQVIEKVEKFSGIRRVNRESAEEFYQQFTRKELICVGR